MKMLAKILLFLMPLAAIGYGLYLAWPPLAFAVPGLLVWIDLGRTKQPAPVVAPPEEQEPSK